MGGIGAPLSGPIHAGMERQLRQWRAALTAGEGRLGWKIGFNRAADQHRFGLPSPMIGHLTSGRQIPPGGSYTFRPGARILAEPEIALLIGRDLAAGATAAEGRAAIAAWAPALELVDTQRTRSGEIEEILAGNLFHEAVVLGEAVILTGAAPMFTLALGINGETVGRLEPERLPEDFGAIAAVTAAILGGHGEMLRAGDWIISGAAATPVELHPGDAVELSLAPLGGITLKTVRGE